MSDDIDAIKQDVAATRARLGASVAELAYRANVPARAKETVDAKIEAVKHSVLGTIGRGRHGAAGVVERTKPVQAMAASVPRRASALRETIGEPLQHINDFFPSSSDSKGPRDIMKAFLARNPLGFGLTAVAIGLLIGFVLPISDMERDAVGPVGEHLIDDASSAATDVIERGKAVVATIVGESRA